MENGNRLSKSAVRSLSLRLRMMRLLGRISLDGLELLLEDGVLHRYRAGEVVSSAGGGLYCYLMLLEGEIEVCQTRCNQVDMTCIYTDQELGCLPLVIPSNRHINITALTDICCLLLDPGLVSEVIWYEQLHGYPASAEFTPWRKTA
jgi:hypothetical protein